MDPQAPSSLLTNTSDRASVGNKKDLSDFTKDWHRLRTQKHRLRGGVEGRIITNLGFWFGEQYLTQAQGNILTRPMGRDDERNKLFLVFNMLRKQAKRKIGRLWSVDPSFAASPNHLDPKAFDKADVVGDLILGLNTKLKERTIHWHRLWWCVIAGVVIEHVPWIEDIADEPLPQFDEQTGELLWKDQLSGSILPQSAVMKLVDAGIPAERFEVNEELQTVGDVGSQIVDPLRFFIDASCPSIDRLAPDQACYIAEIKTIGWIKETFGSDAAKQMQSGGDPDLSIVQTRLLDRGPSVANLNLRDLMPAIQGTRAHDDPPMSIVLTRYQPASKERPHGRRTLFCPNQAMLDDDEIDYGEVPCVDLHFEPATTSFWTGDFMTDLIPGQKFLNKRMSQLGESANAAIYETLLLGSELSASDIPSDLPGVVEDGVSDDGSPRVQVMQRGELPQFFLESIKLISEYIENIGSADLNQSRQFPGQLRGPLAIPMLQELLDSEDGPFFDHMGESLGRIHQMRLNRVKQFYPPIRTLHYTGKQRKDAVLVFHTDDILRSGTDYSITVDRSSLLPELSALRHARVQEDLQGPMSILYTSQRTGRLDPSKIAQALKYTDRDDLDRETKYRKLAQHLIKKLWATEPLPQGCPYPFWDHNAMMDEYEATMATTEWLEATPPIQQAFLQLYDAHRAFLDQIQQAQAQSANAAAMQSAVAQATQQTAAKVAAETVETSIQQIREQVQMANRQPPGQTIQADMAQARANPQQPPQQNRLAPGPQRPALPMNMQQLMHGR